MTNPACLTRNSRSAREGEVQSGSKNDNSPLPDAEFSDLRHNKAKVEERAEDRVVSHDEEGANLQPREHLV